MVVSRSSSHQAERKTQMVFIRFLTSAKTSWIVVVFFLAVAGFVFAQTAGVENNEAPSVGLPDSAESAQVNALIDEFASSEGTSALVVFEKPGESFSDDDVARLTEVASELAEFSTLDFPLPPQISDDRTVALVTIPMDTVSDIDQRAKRANEIREVAASINGGIVSYLSGPEGFEVDVAAVFDGADVTLLIFTAFVVAVLLLVTFRSPILWLIPLLVVGIADGIVAVSAPVVADWLNIALDPSVTGIVSVLVFGAGTNYALLLIARYRDELRLFSSRRDAMTKAVRQAGPAVLASGGTVALALLTLLLGSLDGNRALGFAGAYGIVIAMIAGLVVLPAALVLFGRWLFWPLVPKEGSPDPVEKSLWGKLGRLVAKSPVLVAVGGLALLGILASNIGGVTTGLSQTERFIQKPESVIGQEVLQAGFAAGAGSPAIVIAPVGEAEQVRDAIVGFDGVEQATIAEETTAIARINVVLDRVAESPEARQTIADLRLFLDGVGSGTSLVGGIDAQAADLADATSRDQALVIPLILILVFIVLVLLLRALVAPIILLATVVASYFSAVGASWFIFQNVFGFPALDTNVILLSFLFLVALGVDYSIFLVTRAKEEADTVGLRKGMIRGLAATGAVITSAGVLLAAVFAVLGVLPLITLTQIGVIVCVGVLIDTLLVRTVIVPALAFSIGDTFWWPRKPPVSTKRH
jgi:RND superfamily putative drug exporter